jgi:hypothetical protein
VLLLAQLLAYGLFTYLPPPLGLFEEARSGRSGIPGTAQPLAHDD